MNGSARRIIDANLNRVTEGLRVAEDICRYAWNSRGLQEDLKELRHRVMAPLNGQDIIAARDACGDVGVSSQGALEQHRKDLHDVMRANLKRAQEGLRVLEEILKISVPDISGEYKRIRYHLYTLERTALRRGHDIGRGLYLVMTEPACTYEELARNAVCAGLPVIQLRCKGSADRVFIELARNVREITQGSDTRLIVNDRVDVACLVHADGVHLGQHDMDPVSARRLLGPDAIIGLSTHTLTQVHDARKMPLDYIAFGPVFTTVSKEDPDPATGTALLAQAVSASVVPVVAIGGITRASLVTLKEAGAHAVAVIGAVARAADPLHEMTTLHRAFLEES